MFRSADDSGTHRHRRVYSECSDGCLWCHRIGPREECPACDAQAWWTRVEQCDCGAVRRAYGVGQKVVRTQWVTLER